MPSTTKVDTTLSVNAIGTRTDFAGVAVDDLSAEELRTANEIVSEGVLKPDAAFQVVAGGGGTMDVIVGSGAAKADHAILEGQISGQGHYLVRLDDVTKTITLSAADASQDRTDEIYLVVLDDTYDTSGFSLPILAVREGDVGGGVPGPDAAWEAHTLLASVLVPGGSADITEATITDERVNAAIDTDIGTDRVATAAIQDDAVTQPKIGPGAVGTTEIANNAVTGDKADNGLFTAFEVDANTTEPGRIEVTGSFTLVAEADITIPADWNTYRVFSYCSYSAIGAGADSSYELRLGFFDVSAGFDRVISVPKFATCPSDYFDGSHGLAKSGLTDTGDFKLQIKAREFNSGTSFEDIFIYVRVVRTS